MDLYKAKNDLFFLFKFFIILVTYFMICGYGYSGDLPKLGTSGNSSTQPETPKAPAKSNNQFEFPATKTFFPRIYSNYNIDKYSEYLHDVKEVEPILVNLKELLKSNSPNKVQQFSAKVNVYSLYIDSLKSKYSNKPEKNYESYKQLVILDKHLLEAAYYQGETDKYRKNLRGSLRDKLDDESYMRHKIDMSSNSLNAVLEIIQNAN